MSVESARSHFPPVPPDTGPLWAGVLGAPAAWAAQMQTIYASAHWACERSHRPVLTVVSAVCMIAAVVCGLVCLRYLNRRERDPEFHGRVRFLASLGVLSGAMYAVVIVAQLIATLMLDPCAI